MSALAFRSAAAVWALALSGILLVTGYFMDPDIAAEGRELAQAYAENPERIQVSALSLRFAFAFLIVPVFVLVGRVRERGAWTANVAGIMAVLGLTTLPGLLVVDFYDLAIYGELGGDAWQAVSDRLEALPGMMILFFSAFFPAILALPLALLAAWRARMLSWWPALVAFLGPAVGQVLPGGVGLLVWAAVLGVLAWVLRRALRAGAPDAAA